MRNSKRMLEIPVDVWLQNLDEEWASIIAFGKDTDACTYFGHSNTEHTHRWQTDYGGYLGEDEGDSGWRYEYDNTLLEMQNQRICSTNTKWPVIRKQSIS